jgi:hypothetical protein
MAKSNTEPVLYELNLQTLEITVHGVTPLICNRFSEEKRSRMAGKQEKVARGARPARDPDQEFQDSLYHLAAGTGYGFPAVAFKRACVSACRWADTFPMTQGRGAFHVLGDLLPISGSAPVMRTDRTVIGRGITTLAYRAMFECWEITFQVRYNAAFVSAEQIINLLELAGFAVGIGEWRPECDGNFGMFEIKRSS